ncbi:hypothetical protein ACE02S_15470 [Shewanella xiamenensis]|uniref:hypothetical protein n=1 Tax=Shewanella xiamenensis TaxID=332186 RepID=UPI0035BB76B0
MKWSFPRWCFNPWLHSCLIFLLPILLASTIYPWLTAYSIEKRFNRDFDEITLTFANGVDDFKQKILNGHLLNYLLPAMKMILRYSIVNP